MSQVAAELARAGAPVRMRYHAPAWSAQRRARYLHESGRRVVKTVLVETNRGPVLVLAPACCDLDIDELKKVLGASDVHLVEENRIGKFFPACEHRVVPGFGRLYHIPTVIEERLLEEPYLVIPGDTQSSDFQLEPKVYEDLEQPLRGAFSHPCRMFKGSATGVPERGA